jgi:hypothetical protein
MRRQQLLMAVGGLCSLALIVVPGQGSWAAESASNPGNCKVVEQEGPNTGSAGAMSSSVTAGGGKVSGHTTGPGNSVTVHSGNGNSSSVATAGASGGSTVVTGSGGDCTIYVNPGKKDPAK